MRDGRPGAHIKLVGDLLGGEVEVAHGGVVNLVSVVLIVGVVLLVVVEVGQDDLLLLVVREVEAPVGGDAEDLVEVLDRDALGELAQVEREEDLDGQERVRASLVWWPVRLSSSSLPSRDSDMFFHSSMSLMMVLMS